MPGDRDWGHLRGSRNAVAAEHLFDQRLTVNGVAECIAEALVAQRGSTGTTLLDLLRIGIEAELCEAVCRAGNANDVRVGALE